MISPAFNFSDSTEPVCLHQGHALIELSTGSFEGNVDLQLNLLPRPTIEVVGVFSRLGTSRCRVPFGEEIPTLALDGQPLEGFSRSIYLVNGGIKIRWCPNKTPLQIPDKCDAALDKIIFHLFDFFDLRNLQDGSLTLNDGAWTITIDQEKSVLETTRKIRSDGVTRLTHVAKLARNDGAEFSAQEAERQLTLIHYFLSFVRGAWCTPVCAAGFTVAGVRAWVSYAEPRASQPTAGAWFDQQHPEAMVELYPLFAAKWRLSEAWSDCLREVIYWYVQSNNAGGTPGIDASILLTQAALERLSHQYAVVAQRLMSSEGFKSPQMRASDKLRILLSSLRIPIDVPHGASEISSHPKWKDGPHAVTDIRNSLVHPDAKDREKVFKCVYEGWTLGLWYLELSLLAVFGYEGAYGNRLTRTRVGEIEDVPWAASDDTKLAST